MQKNGQPRVLWISEYKGDSFGLNAEASLVFGLKRLGAEITVMTVPGSPFIKRFWEKGIPVIPEHPGSKWSRKETTALRKRIIEGNFQIIHAFNNRAIIQSLRASRGLPVKILTYRGFAGHIHWYDPSSYLTHLHPRIDGVMCVSQAVKRQLDPQFLFRKPPTRVIYKGHDPAWYRDVVPLDRRELGLEPRDFAVVQVANYRKYKGVDNLVEAFRLLPEELPIHLLLVGRGMDDPQLKKKIQSLPHPERIHLFGYRSDAIRITVSSDLSVNTSWTEAFSKTVLEAVYLKIPVLVTKVGGNVEIIPDDEKGWRVRSKAPAAVASAIEAAFRAPHDRREKASRASEWVQQKFKPEHASQQLLDWYRELISK